MYGCYAGKDTAGKTSYACGPSFSTIPIVATCLIPALQNIHMLWQGDISTKKGALQILLIVDYIYDWAVTIYRSGMLRLMEGVRKQRSITIARLAKYARKKSRNFHQAIDKHRLVKSSSSDSSVRSTSSDSGYKSSSEKSSDESDNRAGYSSSDEESSEESEADSEDASTTDFNESRVVSPKLIKRGNSSQQRPALKPKALRKPPGSSLR